MVPDKNKKNTNGIVVALCVSKEKHVAKHPVANVMFKKDFGIAGDAHAGPTHRQISILSTASVAKMTQAGALVGPGSFGENLLVEGLSTASLKVGDQIAIGDSVCIEVTQLGKECHDPCAISKSVGFCIMPSDGIFARVMSSGEVKTLDPVIIIKTS